MKPMVAIVGRPNVGKSTFFNRLAGYKLSIVENTPGVTRDRVYADTEWNGKIFTVIDTGGLEIKSEDEMYIHIKKQAEIAVEMADVIIFFTDGKQGLTPADYEVADYLRRSGKPIVLAVNKIDNYRADLVFEFYSLGLGEPFAISSEQGQGIGDLLDEVVANMSRIEYEEEDTGLKIAVVGKPNAGKSTLCNKLLGYERTIVSDIAGTTRDAIDSIITINDKNYTIIDTAGIRRKSRVDEDVEYYSVLRAFGAIRRADVCAVVIDSSEKQITEQDVKICAFVHNENKPSVIVMNKWDTVEKDTFTVNSYNNELASSLSFMSYFKPIYISAKTGKRVEKFIETCEYVHQRNSFRPTTGLLNEILQEAIRMSEPPTYQGRRLKLYYATAQRVNPPTFILFCNDDSLMKNDYKRYLENQIRKAFNYEGTPIKLIVRSREEDQ